MTAGSRRIGLYAAVAALAGALALAAPAAATFPGDNGRIASRQSSTNAEPPGFMTMNPDGTDERVTPLPRSATGVRWSPDGRRVTFVMSSGATSTMPHQDVYPNEIYVADADGGNLVRLTSNNHIDGTPAWSPDGRWIAFQRDGIPSGGGPVAVYLVAADGSVPERRLAPSDSFGLEWLPDGSGIVYSGLPDEQSQVRSLVVVSPADGSRRELPVEDAHAIRDFSLSPDGSAAVVEQGSGSGNSIWRVRLDGSARTQLYGPPGTPASWAVSSPFWSPDGTTVAFCRFVPGEEDESGLFAMDADGTDVRRIGPRGCGGDWQALPRQAPPAGPPGGGPAPGPGDPPGGPPGLAQPSGPCSAVQVGTARADSLVGTAAGDRLTGGAGHDRLTGLAGADCLFGDAGNDHLRGGAGDDRLDGAAGLDTLLGGDGSDVLAGGPGRDRLDGGAGADVLRGGPAYDVVRGGAGDDRVDVRGGQPDTVDCGHGFDLARVSRSDRVRNCERVVRAR